MNKQQLEQVVLQVLGKIVPGVDRELLKPKVSFHDQLEIDSIDYLCLMMELEKTLKIRIPDLEYPQLSTLQGCLSYLMGQLNLREAVT
jgi:acyl carrier protein